MAIVQGQLRCILAPRVYTLPLVRAIGRTMVQGKNYGPQITVKRISTRYAVTIAFYYLSLVINTVIIDTSVTVKPFNLTALKVGDFARKIILAPFILAISNHTVPTHK